MDIDLLTNAVVVTKYTLLLLVIHRNHYFGFGRNRNRNPLGSAETETGTETETLWNNLLLYPAKIRFGYTHAL